MKKHFEPVASQPGLRDKLLGLGEDSLRKSYYPELQRQLENLRERVGLAELVAAIGQSLTEEQDLRTSLQRCTDTLVQQTDAAFVRIWTLSSDGDTLELQASSGLSSRIDGRHSRMSLSRYPYKVGIIAREQQPYLTNQVLDNDQFHDQEWVKSQGIVAFAGYPLALQHRLIGVIALFAQQPLNEAALNTLETIANQLAVGIERFQALAVSQAALASARQNMETINGILRSVADAILVIDDRQRILHMNQAAEALLGTSLITAYHQRVGQVTNASALLDYLDRIDQFIDQDSDIDLDIIDMNRHEWRVIQARAAHLTGTHADSGLVISLRDVTQDREVARMKSEFIMTAAHELRTPLTTIMGFAELINSEEYSGAEQREYLGYIIDKAESLEQIIDDLLDLSRIESGRGLSLNCSDWNLASTLEKFMARYRTEYPDYCFKAAIPADLGTIHADHGKLLQVLDNLFSNAIKYSPQGTEIRLNAECRDERLQLTVVDQGIGMTEEQLGNCFEKFYRANSSTTAVGGLGLGLSIVRHVVESHHGQISIASTPGQGTAVTISLPMTCTAGRTDQ